MCDEDKRSSNGWLVWAKDMLEDGCLLASRLLEEIERLRKTRGLLSEECSEMEGIRDRLIEEVDGLLGTHGVSGSINALGNGSLVKPEVQEWENAP